MIDRPRAFVALGCARARAGHYISRRRVTGSARTDSNGVTTFRDAVGRTTGSARTDSNGVTTFHDAAGRVTGSRQREPRESRRL